MSKIYLYPEAVKEAERRSVETDQAVYLLPVRAYVLTDDIEDASMYPDSDVIRVNAHKHFSGANP